ncbi:hypothetical protein B0H14DRAFT_3516502 [Mycena olivaceomarginata]|nr:hypothetical protein B0H14DRAFT_3516502 [Mycena olivaceomarginata]
MVRVDRYNADLMKVEHYVSHKRAQQKELLTEKALILESTINKTINYNTASPTLALPYATPAHGSSTPLRRFSAHAHFHATALSSSSPLSRVRPLAMHSPLHSHVASFSCGRHLYRSSVAPLDIHAEVILMRIAPLSGTSH